MRSRRALFQERPCGRLLGLTEGTKYLCPLYIFMLMDINFYSAKMCMSDADGGEDDVAKGLIMTDSMQVLTMLTDRIEVHKELKQHECTQYITSQHPAGHMIHSAVLSHHSNYGCGVTSLVCIGALWSGEISDLIKQVKTGPQCVLHSPPHFRTSCRTYLSLSYSLCLRSVWVCVELS